MKTTTTPEGNLTWHFSKQELAALLAFMTTDGTRYTLWGLAFDPTTGRVWSSDGHRGALVDACERVDQDRAVLGEAFLVPRNKIEARMVEQKSAPEITFTRADAGKTKPANLVQVLPEVGSLKEHRGVATGFNAAYLADLELIQRAIPPIVIQKPRGKKDKLYATAAVYPPAEPLAPMRVEFEARGGNSHWTAVIMPCRV